MNLAKVIKPLAIARSGLYFLESLPFAFFSRVIAHPDLPPPKPDEIKALWKHILALHDREEQNLERGYYPARALELENPIQHARSYFRVLSDGFRVAWRMRQGKTKEFDARESEGAPDYYARNFHFQTDGYFSESSARRYDHQVEILFSGTAGAMRRMILPVLFQKTIHTGRWLELGCGAGSATRAVLESFPKAHVTATDLSRPYLKVAQDQLRPYPNVDFVHADATHLPFREESFEAVFSVYLLHELPKEVREDVVREAFRVLKPGGVLIFADSLQWNDQPELNWALERFPKVYHEPFYKNYLKDDMAKLLNRITKAKAESEHAFLTKMAWVQKPLNSALS